MFKLTISEFYVPCDTVIIIIGAGAETDRSSSILTIFIEDAGTRRAEVTIECCKYIKTAIDVGIDHF